MQPAKGSAQSGALYPSSPFYSFPSPTILCLIGFFFSLIGGSGSNRPAKALHRFPASETEAVQRAPPLFEVNQAILAWYMYAGLLSGGK